MLSFIRSFNQNIDAKDRPLHQATKILFFTLIDNRSSKLQDLHFEQVPQNRFFLEKIRFFAIFCPKNIKLKTLNY